MHKEEAHGQRQRLGVRVVNYILIFPVGRGRDKAVKLRKREVEPVQRQFAFLPSAPLNHFKQTKRHMTSHRLMRVTYETKSKLEIPFHHVSI